MRAQFRLTLAGLVTLAGVPACSEDAESPTAWTSTEAAPSVVASATGLRVPATERGRQAHLRRDDRRQGLLLGQRLPRRGGQRCAPLPILHGLGRLCHAAGCRGRGTAIPCRERGLDHSCGVTTDDRAYCWGSNGSGALGIGTSAGPDICAGNESNWSCSTVPVAVLGGLRFRTVSVGVTHTCGVTTDGLAYCWGSNYSGQLGDGTTTRRLKPRLVAGGLRYGSVSAGGGYTCALGDGRPGLLLGLQPQRAARRQHAHRPAAPPRAGGGRASVSAARRRLLYTCAIASTTALGVGGRATSVSSVSAEF